MTDDYWRALMAAGEPHCGEPPYGDPGPVERDPLSTVLPPPTAEEPSATSFSEWLRPARDWSLPEGASPWLVAGLLDAGLSLVSGADKAGKSTLMYSLAVALQRGDADWCGFPITVRSDGHRVAYLATDAGGVWEARRRLVALDPDHGGDVLVAPLDPDDRARSWPWIRSGLRDAGVSLVVVDHATGAMPLGVGMNDASDSQHLLRPLRKIADDGMAVVLLTHTAKPQPGRKGEPGSDGRSPLGSRAWSAAARCKVLVEKVNDGHRKLRVEGTNTGDRTVEFDVRVTGDGVLWAPRPQTPSGQARKAQRSSETLNRNAEIAAFVAAECGALSNVKTGERIAERFGGSPDVWAGRVGKGGPLEPLLTRGPEDVWQLRKDGAQPST